MYIYIVSAFELYFATYVGKSEKAIFLFEKLNSESNLVYNYVCLINLMKTFYLKALLIEVNDCVIIIKYYYNHSTSLESIESTHIFE